MEFAFVCMGKKSISVESAEYFPNMEFVLGNIVRIDEYVVQIYDDYDINHICKNVFHKSLKSGRCISKPFRHYQPLEGTMGGFGMQSSIHLQVKSILGGRRARDHSWCRLVPFVVRLGGWK